MTRLLACVGVIFMGHLDDAMVPSIPKQLRLRLIPTSPVLQFTKNTQFTRYVGLHTQASRVCVTVDTVPQ